ncbi:hypothetical protein MG5_02211 [Candida albicans P57072]|uniref:Uncharacterized protein n=1 Tax=Candida albicans (strain WO-1) TaxID=294748 RepID=C4YKB4_CANAW|nr:conserved hypothetical protein [Candida albicans WO-1]KGR11664.1 hypothetical protein MG5_02211 [Candida albicans P57072]KGR21154.1 hypothetical protein MG9_02226 [Candida albicans P37037]KGU11116.1 hypothetical protein MEQ_02195 [Candida albicans P87]KGU13899.1 hypothetical protein MEY_02225 [Candida albicans 19F]KGU28877.1 hypothetical protein MG7_02228 [Candida albicans P34048]KHC45914.1 hypothetical protein W5O_02219 [Candida albicans Ca6]KHC53889.1 hypothetical protein MEW_02162 [Can
MGYPPNFKIVTKSLTENILLASTAFSRVDKFNFGARMAVFKFPQSNKIILWSPLPYTPQVIDVLTKFTNNTNESNLNIAYVIIPDREHNLAAKSYKEKFPGCKLIGMEGLDENSLKLDYKFIKSMGNKVLKNDDLRQIFNDNDSGLIVDNFEFVYLPNHANQELVVFDKSSSTLFEADLLFNLGVPGSTSGETILEQYSPELGFPKGFNPHSGWSFITRYLQPYSKVGRFLFRKLVDINHSKPGLEAIYNSWDFKTIVMCHGNIITKDAKEAFKHVFV